MFVYNLVLQHFCPGLSYERSTPAALFCSILSTMDIKDELHVRVKECDAMQDYTLGQLEQNEKLRARQLCRTLSQLGPSFVKIGQALSSRPDLLPQIYLEVWRLCRHQL